MKTLEKMLGDDWDTGLEVGLRPYQKECLDGIKNSLIDKNLKSAIVSLPTGAGKTIIFSTFAHKQNFRTLVIAHREELLEQAVEKFSFITGRSDTGYKLRDRWDDAFFTAGSVQTLYANLDKVNGKDYDLLVIDECHHLPAPTYQAVVNRLFETNPDLKMLGVTATPFRSDKENLADYFEEKAYEIDIKELIRLGYLVPFRGKRIYLNVDLDKANVYRGDFTNSSLAEILNTEEINREIVRKWIDEAEGRKTIFFTSSVEHAKELAEEFRRNGIPSAYIEGNFSLKQRRNIIKRFREGKIQVLTNMNILTEGFDDPSVECISLIRPTKSLNLYVQMVGRGLRLSPETGKKDCLILDFSGVTRRHSLIGIGSLFGIELSREEEEKGIAVGSIETESGERKIKVLVGNHKEEFVFEGIEAYEHITKIKVNGETYFLLTCGSNKTIMAKKGVKTNTLYRIENGKLYLLKRNIPDDVLGGLMINVWQQEREDWVEGFMNKHKNDLPTDKQMLYIWKALGSGKFEVDVEKLTKTHASNVLSFLFGTRTGKRLIREW